MSAQKQSKHAQHPEGKVKKKKVFTGDVARVYISCSFNNTIITLTDEKGNPLAWSSAGVCGFSGTKKGTPFAAQMVATDIAKKALNLGVKKVIVLVKGPGPGRETSIRTLQTCGLTIVSIRDITPIPHDGCRPPKMRRV
jgi:small subunit ribosomal protein S11